MSAELPIRVVARAFEWFNQAVLQRLTVPLQSVLQHHPLPKPVRELNSQFVKLWNKVYPHSQNARDAAHPMQELRTLLGLDAQSEPVFKIILVRFRRFLATETEQFLDRIHDPTTRDSVESDLHALERFLNEITAEGYPPALIPSLLDFVSLRDADFYVQEPQRLSKASAATDTEFHPQQAKPAQQAYDEKFHILRSPTLFLTDLHLHRSVCDLRRLPCTVAFIDIDHFKDFNTEVTETEVDKSVLPLFMRTAEAHFFGHGSAYRQGGDEYLAILPGLSKRFAIEFFDDLRIKLGSLEYSTTKRRTTVSIGLCVAEPDCPLTDRELQKMANLAKKHAKDSGRNCISTFKGDVSQSEELEKVRPIPT